VPQSSKELRDEWEADDHAVYYLEGRGFNLTRRWTWRAPEGREPTEIEWRAIQYLIEEWDFGGLDRPNDIQERKEEK